MEIAVLSEINYRGIKKVITQEYLKQRLSYDKKSGIFTWLPYKYLNIDKCYKIAGTTHHMGYIVIGLGNHVYQAHRLAWLYIYGKWPEQVIDHINGNKIDNRLCNLRDVSQSINVKACYKRIANET